MTFPPAPVQSPPDWRDLAASANGSGRPNGPTSPWAEPPQRLDPAVPDRPATDPAGPQQPGDPRVEPDPHATQPATTPPAATQSHTAQPRTTPPAAPATPAPQLPPATPPRPSGQAQPQLPGPAQPQPSWPAQSQPVGPTQPQPSWPAQPSGPVQPQSSGAAQPQHGSYPVQGYQPGPAQPPQPYPATDQPGHPGRGYPSQEQPGQIPLDQTQPIPSEPQSPGQQLAPWQLRVPAPTSPHPSPQYGGPPLPVPQQQYLPAPQSPPSHSPAVPMSPVRDPDVPTADEFARRRVVRPAEPVARLGLRGAVSRGSLGLVKLPPGAHEREILHQIEMVRRNFGGLRQVTVVNPKGGAGKTVAVLLLAMTFGQRRGGYVLAWDNNETQGTLGMRAQQDFHARTVRDLLRDLDHFSGPHGRVGDLSQYVRAQGEGMFDVLASDESATAGEMLTAGAFADIREVVSRFYKLIMVDTGNNVRAANWQAAIDATDQLVVTMSARNDSAETAARMLDHLEQSGRQRLVRQAVTVVSMPPSRKEIDLPAIRRHFAARTRAVLLAPYERLIDSGEPLRYGLLSSATKQAWLRVASAVAEGL
ncbi:MinD/ParA family ATP-binding protein [Rugosimonospora africana]